VTVIHGALLLTAHIQPTVVVTVIVLVPPPDTNVALVGEIE
jgi:hypothetical protein